MKAALVALAVMAASATAATAGESIHLYNVQGTNLDGSPYSGTAAIEPTSDDTCHIAWKTGSTTSGGFCMKSGNIVSAAYVLGNVVGLVMYEIQTDGSLHGVWTIEGKQGLGTEILTPAQ